MALTVPVSIDFEGKELSFWTYPQLNQLSSTALKQRAMNVRDVVGETRLGRMPRDKDNCIAWIITAQIRAMAASGGGELQAADFGLPKDMVDLVGEPAPFAGADEPPVTARSEAADDYNSARAVYEAAKVKNRTGSNIFGA